MKIQMTTRAICLAVCLVSLAGRIESGAAQKTPLISVASGALDRRNTVVTFSLPKVLAIKSYGLRDDAGRGIPLQIDAERNASFVLAELKAGTTKTYRLIAPSSRWRAKIAAMATARAPGRRQEYKPCSRI